MLLSLTPGLTTPVIRSSTEMSRSADCQRDEGSPLDPNVSRVRHESTHLTAREMRLKELAADAKWLTVGKYLRGVEFFVDSTKLSTLFRPLFCQIAKMPYVVS